jgi:GAF domain-containing protein
MPVDLERVTETLSRLEADELEAAGVAVALQQIVDTAQKLFGVTGTGLMFIDDGEALRYVAATDEPGRVLEVAQEEHGVGPCVDALVHDSVIAVDDMSVDRRYQAIAPTVTARGVLAVLGVPVHLGGAPVGSLNAYANEPRQWDASDVSALSAFTGLIEGILTSALLSQRQSSLVEQLEFALQNRVTIERAVGVVMARQRIGAVAAFNSLRGDARRQRRKVASVAADLLRTFEPAPTPPPSDASS